MNGTVDIHATDDQQELDPRAAAMLLEETSREARRQLDPTDMVRLSLTAALLFLVIYGGLYVAAHGEHPYIGPHGPWLMAWPVGVCAALLINANRYDQLKRTRTGATLLRVRASGAAVVVGLIGIYALDAALANAGVGKDIIYGIFDAAAPLIVLGSIGAANAAWREDWPTLGASLGLILVAAGASFAGPDGVWGVIAIGGCLVSLGHAVARRYVRDR
jgi:cation transport ATPase